MLHFYAPRLHTFMTIVKLGLKKKSVERRNTVTENDENTLKREAEETSWEKEPLTECRLSASCIWHTLRCFIPEPPVVFYTSCSDRLAAPKHGWPGRACRLNTIRAISFWSPSSAFTPIPALPDGSSHEPLLPPSLHLTFSAPITGRIAPKSERAKPWNGSYYKNEYSKLFLAWRLWCVNSYSSDSSASLSTSFASHVLTWKSMAQKSGCFCQYFDQIYFPKLY